MPTYSADDYAQAMANLLPRGFAWNRDPSSNLYALLKALAPTYQRSGQAGTDLIPDVSPATTLNFIKEWEETLGLPDKCTPPNPTLEQRKRAILAKFIGSGGQSVPYYTAVAKAIGYDITIRELSTPHHWEVRAIAAVTSYFRLGTNQTNDYFWTIGSGELECRLRAIMPAHTVLNFVYATVDFYSNGGVLTLVTPPAGYPTDPTGLPAGSVWSNNGAVAVVPGVVPNPSAPPLYFASTTAAALLALGGGDLPLTNPGDGTEQLWNNGGEVTIA